MTTWPRTWSACWIWLDEPDSALDSVVFLRRVIDLASVPARAPCRVTADGRYQLFVNGTRIGRGPVRGEPTHLRWDEYDVAPYLVSGANAVAVLARNYGRATQGFKPPLPVGQLGRGGVLLEAQLGGQLLVTDSGWRASLAPYERRPVSAWTGNPAAEVLDGARLPNGWTEPGYDDRGWQPAQVLTPQGLGINERSTPTDPFAMLDAADIGQLEEHLLTPLQVVARGGTHGADLDPDPLQDFQADPSGSVRPEAWAACPLVAGEWVTVDFGRLSNSHPTLLLDADAGSVVDLAVGEDLDVTGHPVAAPRNWTMRYTAGGRESEQVEALEAVGFRWLQVTIRSGVVRSLDVRALFRHYPRPASASFTCDDEDLNGLWTMGGATLDACSTDAFIDCPGREQRAWVGDAYVETLVSLACNPDTGLVRHNAELLWQGVRADGLRPMVAGADLTDHVSTIPDFSLHWVRSIARIYEHLGDVDGVERLWGRVLDCLQWFEWHRAPDGLLRDLTGWIWIDWAQTERARNTAAADALYAMALEDAAMLAEALDEHGSARRFRERLAMTRAAFETYWDEQRGVYVDAADGMTKRGRRVSQQTNALAILAGAAPRHRWGGMLDYVLDAARLVHTRHPGDGSPIEQSLRYQWMPAQEYGGGKLLDEASQVVLAQPFFAHFLHQALAAAGRHDDLLASIRRWQKLAQRGNGVFEEYWDHVPGYGSRCHAWSATPTYDLTTHVLGVRRIGVAWSEVLIEPRFGPLTRLAGTVPTPNGAILLELNRATGGWIELPAGVSGSVRRGGTELVLRAGRNPVRW